MAPARQPFKARLDGAKCRLGNEAETYVEATVSTQRLPRARGVWPGQPNATFWAGARFYGTASHYCRWSKRLNTPRRAATRSCR